MIDLATLGLDLSVMIPLQHVTMREMEQVGESGVTKLDVIFLLAENNFIRIELQVVLISYFRLIGCHLDPENRFSCPDTFGRFLSGFFLAFFGATPSFWPQMSPRLGSRLGRDSPGS